MEAQVLFDQLIQKSGVWGGHWRRHILAKNTTTTLTQHNTCRNRRENVHAPRLHGTLQHATEHGLTLGRHGFPKRQLVLQTNTGMHELVKFKKTARATAACTILKLV